MSRTSSLENKDVRRDSRGDERQEKRYRSTTTGHTAYRPSRRKKTEICRHWLKGICKNNPCRYAHGKDELETPQGRGLMYKTSICKTFLDGGNCEFGAGCRYAHGEGDLRKMPDLKNPNVRRILELEKENTMLRRKLKELEGALGSANTQMVRIPQQQQRIPIQMQVPQQHHQQQIIQVPGMPPIQTQVVRQQQVQLPPHPLSYPQHPQRQVIHQPPVQPQPTPNLQAELAQQQLLLQLLPLLQQQQQQLKQRNRSSSPRSRRRRRSRSRSRDSY